jgi:hypothetical protein
VSTCTAGQTRRAALSRATLDGEEKIVYERVLATAAQTSSEFALLQVQGGRQASGRLCTPPGHGRGVLRVRGRVPDVYPGPPTALPARHLRRRAPRHTTHLQGGLRHTRQESGPLSPQLQRWHILRSSPPARINHLRQTPDRDACSSLGRQLSHLAQTFRVLASSQNAQRAAKMHSAPPKCTARRSPHEEGQQVVVEIGLAAVVVTRMARLRSLGNARREGNRSSLDRSSSASTARLANHPRQASY